MLPHIALYYGQGGTARTTVCYLKCLSALTLPSIVMSQAQNH